MITVECWTNKIRAVLTYTTLVSIGSKYFHLQASNLVFSFSQSYLVNKRHGSSGWNRQHHGQTIHPTIFFISMNLFKILWVVIWAWSFLTSEVMEAVRGQKHYILAHTLALITNVRFIPQRQFCLPRNEISNNFQPPYLEFVCLLIFFQNNMISRVMPKGEKFGREGGRGGQ